MGEYTKTSEQQRIARALSTTLSHQPWWTSYAAAAVLSAPRALLEALRVTTPIPFSRREAAGRERGHYPFFLSNFFLSRLAPFSPDTTPSPPLATIISPLCPSSPFSLVLPHPLPRPRSWWWWWWWWCCRCCLCRCCRVVVAAERAVVEALLEGRTLARATTRWGGGLGRAAYPPLTYGLTEMCTCSIRSDRWREAPLETRFEWW